MKKLILLLLYILITLSIHSTDTYSYDFVYQQKGEIYFKNYKTGAGLKITSTSGKIKTFVLAESQNKLMYTTLENTEDRFLSMMYELNLTNLKTVLIKSEVIMKKDFEDELSEHFYYEKQILKPLGYNPEDENLFIYNNGKVKALYKGKDVDWIDAHENYFENKWTGITKRIYWGKNFFIINAYGYEAEIQYVYKKIGKNKYKYLDHKDLKLGGFYDRYQATGFLSSDILIINSLMNDENKIIFYDIDALKKIKEFNIKANTVVIPFKEKLYSLNKAYFGSSVKAEFNLVDENGIFHLINSLKMIPHKNKITTGVFEYNPERFLIYGRSSNSFYCYNLIEDKFYNLDKLDWSSDIYLFDRKEEYRMRSTVNGLRIRENMSLKSSIVYKLKKDESVQILEIGKLEKIDGVVNNWFKVKTKTGAAGWCFGGYLAK